MKNKMTSYYQISEKKSIHSHYINTDAFVLGIKTNDNIKDLYDLKDWIDFRNLNKENK